MKETCNKEEDLTPVRERWGSKRVTGMIHIFAWKFQRNSKKIIYQQKYIK